MTWVTTFAENEATGRLAEVYEEVCQHPMSGGQVANVIACMGLRPEAVRGVWQMNMGITFGASTLGRTREEIIATSVSALNGCHY